MYKSYLKIAVSISIGIFFCGVNLSATQNLREHDEPGYVQYIEPVKQREIKAKLPILEDQYIHARMIDPKTMWYDDESMVFLYQDSIESVVGGRANHVARDVGERATHPDIRRLTKYFGPDKKFRFPFRTAAGTDGLTNVSVVNFWSPAKDKQGTLLPVKWWKASRRGRWHWVHPVDTLIGEVLFVHSNDGERFVFEIRIRRRYSHGWDVDVFRPFQNSGQLIEAIKKFKPDWQQNDSLKRVMNHLNNKATLTTVELEGTVYPGTFPKVTGVLDFIPEFNDDELVKKLLTATEFKTTQGRIWRENEYYEAYAPSSSAAFSIVPGGYQLGLIPVNEFSCKRCHKQTGRALGDFDPIVQLYGEIWGEDQIFTWHLFKDHRGIHNTFDDVDGSRIINPRLVQSGLVKNEKPSATDEYYKALHHWPLP